MPKVCQTSFSLAKKTNCFRIEDDKRFIMKHLQVILFFTAAFFVSSCSQQGVKEEEEVDYDNLVKAEDGEWTDLQHVERQKITGEIFPDPQEVVILEVPDLGAVKQ